MPGLFDNEIVGCRPGSSSLGPTDVDSVGEVVEEDCRPEAQSQADSDDEPVWSLPHGRALVRPAPPGAVCVGRFAALAGDEGVPQRRRRLSLVSQVAENAPIVRVSEMGSALQEDLPAPEIPPRLEVAFSHIQMPRTFLTGQRHPISRILQTMRVQTTKKLIEPG